MKKNGFTLIELLAIIVILAIIAVITVPIILNVIDNAERGSAEDSALGYKDALQKYYATKLVQNPEQELPNGIVMVLSLPNDFTASGELPSDGWVNLSNGNVTEYSLKFGDYVVTKLGNQNVVSEKSEYVRYNIPEEYQRVEYLQSTGSQYIDTGTYLLDGEKASIKFSINDYKDYQVIFGQTSTGFGSLQARPKFNWYYKTSGISIDPVLNKLYTCTAGFNGSTGEVNLDGNVGSFDVSEDNTNMLLFSRQNATNYEMNGRVYSFGMGTRRSMVPVVRKNDNKPGMLDMANYSRNLFDKDNATIVNRYVSTDKKIAASSHARSIIIPCQPNTTYTFSKIQSTRFYLGYTTTEIETDTDVYNNTIDNNATHLTITTGENAKYLVVYVYNSIYDTNTTLEEILDSIQLEFGSIATQYEPYKKSFYTNDGTGEFIAGPEI